MSPTRRDVTLAALLGSIGGMLFGYYRFGGVGWAFVFAVAFGGICGWGAWKSSRNRETTRLERRSFAPVAALFGILVLAFLIGLAAGSVHVFIVVYAAGIGLFILLRLTVWRR